MWYTHAANVDEYTVSLQLVGVTHHFEGSEGYSVSAVAGLALYVCNLLQMPARHLLVPHTSEKHLNTHNNYC